MDSILTFQKLNNYNMRFIGPKSKVQMRKYPKTNFVIKKFNRQCRGFRGRDFNRREKNNNNRDGNNGNNRGSNVPQRGRGYQIKLRIRGGNQKK